MTHRNRLPAAMGTMIALAVLAFAPPVTAQQSLVERGSYLVNGILNCGNCHHSRDEQAQFIPGMEFAGGFRFNEMPAFDAYARNITPDVDTGIGAWSEQEIIDAVREGRTPEDETIGVPMPIHFYTNMDDDDAAAMAAYLKSMPAVRNEIPEATYNIPKGPYPPASHREAPSPADTVAYGGYLVEIGHCFDCHTPRNPDGSPDMSRAGGGGFAIAVAPNGNTIYTANITPDRETGIGDWTDDQMRRAITEGIGEEDHPLFPLMPAGFFKNMTSEDVGAVIAYLRTIPAVSNEVERNEWRPGM